jgi:hypothetical protein
MKMGFNVKKRISIIPKCLSILTIKEPLFLQPRDYWCAIGTWGDWKKAKESCSRSFNVRICSCLSSVATRSFNVII